MLTIKVDFETIENGYDTFNYSSELHHDINCQGIIKSTIIKCFLKEQSESDTRNDLLHIIDRKIS